MLCQPIFVESLEFARVCLDFVELIFELVLKPLVFGAGIENRGKYQ